MTDMRLISKRQLMDPKGIFSRGNISLEICTLDIRISLDKDISRLSEV